MKATDINEFAVYWWKQLVLMSLLSTDDTTGINEFAIYLLMVATDINKFAIYWWKQLALMNLLSADSNWHWIR